MPGSTSDDGASPTRQPAHAIAGAGSSPGATAAAAASYSPSAVPPYWSFTTRDMPHQQSAHSISLYPAPATLSASGRPGGGDQSRQQRARPIAAARPIDVHPWRTAAADSRDTDSGREEDDPFKPPVSGANAVPLSPRSSLRMGLSLPSVGLESAMLAEDNTASAVVASVSPASAGVWPQSQQAGQSSAHDDEEESYIRPCSFLRPGAIFTGHQSFTSVFSPSCSTTSYSYNRSPERNVMEPSSPSSSSRTPHWTSPQRTSAGHPGMHENPYSALSRNPPSWSDIAGSAIDPSITALLGATPAFGYSSHASINNVGVSESQRRERDRTRGRARQSTSGSGISKSSSSAPRDDWEVEVCISHVDWERGRLEGVMKALNVPGTLTREGGASSQAQTSSVTTSFTGEIVDLHNYGVWTRDAPDAAHAHFGAAASASGAHHEVHWLHASAGAIDRSTDLEYWSRTAAFEAYGPGAEKEICRLAREHRWEKGPECRSRRKVVGADWVLMRWKERDFIDCEARSSGLTISGFYYICLNRRSGELTGFYHDPMSTPHQRLVLRPAETMHRCSRDSIDGDGMDDGEGADEPVEVAGGHWFATYTTL